MIFLLERARSARSLPMHSSSPGAIQSTIPVSDSSWIVLPYRAIWARAGVQRLLREYVQSHENCPSVGVAWKKGGMHHVSLLVTTSF